MLVVWNVVLIGAGAVNLAEVVSRLQDLGSDEGRIYELLEPLRLDVRDHDEALAWTTGLLRAATRQFGLSLGDRACLALALMLRLQALTADRHWAGVDVGVEVVLCR